MKTHPRYLAAFRSSVPELLAPSDTKRTCLYVGAWPDGCALIPELREAGYKITILEIWPAYVEAVKEMLVDDEEIILGDARTWRADHAYDLVMWWHGPEHARLEDREETLKRLVGWASGCCVVAGPWGLYGQEPIHGNPHQEHVSQLTHKWFADRGWTVATYGTPNMPGGEVVAWKTK